MKCEKCGNEITYEDGKIKIKVSRNRGAMIFNLMCSRCREIIEELRDKLKEAENSRKGR